MLGDKGTTSFETAKAPRTRMKKKHGKRRLFLILIATSLTWVILVYYVARRILDTRLATVNDIGAGDLKHLSMSQSYLRKKFPLPVFNTSKVNLQHPTIPRTAAWRLLYFLHFHKGERTLSCGRPLLFKTTALSACFDTNPWRIWSSQRAGRHCATKPEQ